VCVRSTYVLSQYSQLIRSFTTASDDITGRVSHVNNNAVSSNSNCHQATFSAWTGPEKWSPENHTVHKNSDIWTTKCFWFVLFLEYLHLNLFQLNKLRRHANDATAVVRGRPFEARAHTAAFRQTRRVGARHDSATFDRCLLANMNCLCDRAM
jgi:hypothetical protein